jgi:hypothetical protein
MGIGSKTRSKSLPPKTEGFFYAVFAGQARHKKGRARRPSFAFFPAKALTEARKRGKIYYGNKII